MMSALFAFVLGAAAGYLMVDVFGAPLWTACIVAALLGVIVHFVAEDLR